MYKLRQQFLNNKPNPTKVAELKLKILSESINYVIAMGNKGYVKTVLQGIKYYKAIHEQGLPTVLDEDMLYVSEAIESLLNDFKTGAIQNFIAKPESK